MVAEQVENNGADGIPTHDEKITDILNFHSNGVHGVQSQYYWFTWNRYGYVYSIVTRLAQMVSILFRWIIKLL